MHFVDYKDKSHHHTGSTRLRDLDCGPILHAQSLTESLKRPLAGSFENSFAVPLDRLTAPTLARPLNVQYLVPLPEPPENLLAESRAAPSTVAPRFWTSAL